MSDVVVPLRRTVALAPVQGTLALALQPEHEPPALPGVPSGSDVRDTSRHGVVPHDVIEAWSRRFVQAALEIVGGDRPASQLARWADRSVYADLQRRAWLVARAGGHVPGTERVQPVRPRVRSVRPCMVDETTVEVAVHVTHGGRSRAVAARFELRRERWTCTALDFS